MPADTPTPVHGVDLSSARTGAITARRVRDKPPSQPPDATPAHIGSYDIERRLGGGGMAEVFVAQKRGARGFFRRVAIKRVLPSFAGHPAAAGLFISEATVSAQLCHPNIVSVLDFKHDPQYGLFLVMELVEGRDLGRLLRAGPLSVPCCIFIACEVLRGLAYAHHLPARQDHPRGVIHRDVSPHNVLLSWDGAVKISDFGVAKVRAASRASGSLVLKGKPAYMSPEQAQGKSLDGRADLFSVGAVLWEMLVGRPLFAGASVQETLSALLFLPVVSPRALRGEVPEELAAVVLRLLQRDPSQRYGSAEEALGALVACARAPRDGRTEVAETLRQAFPAEAPKKRRSAPLPRTASGKAASFGSQLALEPTQWAPPPVPTGTVDDRTTRALRTAAPEPKATRKAAPEPAAPRAAPPHASRAVTSRLPPPGARPAPADRALEGARDRGAAEPDAGRGRRAHDEERAQKAKRSGSTRVAGAALRRGPLAWGLGAAIAAWLGASWVRDARSRPAPVHEAPLPRAVPTGTPDPGSEQAAPAGVGAMVMPGGRSGDQRGARDGAPAGHELPEPVIPDSGGPSRRSRLPNLPSDFRDL